MSLPVIQGNHPIDLDTRSLISTRYRTITKAVNGDFWNCNSETEHSRYVGSYGRGTAINTSDLDVLMELPQREYIHFDNLSSNGSSRLLQYMK
ncbi:MAG: nucleotidyltransferase domain-containing protein [Lentisphaeria bacterium]|nr:nucleotidyltransferase domain-containing protein [Lentisphaeria bacterium]